MLRFPYGVDSTAELPFAVESLAAHFRGPPSLPAGEIVAAAAQAIALPLDFPPLAQIAVPGDHVALPVDVGTPAAAEMLAPVVETLVAAGVAPADITVLISPADATAPDPRRLLRPEWQAAVVLEIHDGVDRKKLGYLAATRTGERIYLNRVLTDADLVIPIGAFRHDRVLDYRGTASGVFPTFSDEATQIRYRQLELDAISREAPLSRVMHLSPARQEVDEASWLLGVQFVVQAVPAAGGGVLEILAGEVRAVGAEGRLRLAQAWTAPIPTPAPVVLATLAGPAEQQTWDAVARALVAAADCVTEQGAIVLWTDLGVHPAGAELGPALSSLRKSRDGATALRKLRTDAPIDITWAAQLVQATSRARVYLLSKLDSTLVEDLGLAPAANAREALRVATEAGQTILLEDAGAMRVAILPAK